MTDIEMYTLAGTIWIASAIANTEIGRKIAGFIGVGFCLASLILMVIR